MKLRKFILIIFVILSINSCQNNNELNTQTLKINVTLNTPIDLDNSNWLASLFKSFNIDSINYVSKNNNDKIGINLNRIDVKKFNSLNLEMFDGNGLRNTMGVYDNSNLVADLEKLNIRNIFTNSNLLQFISNVPQKSYNESEYDGIINISSPLTESQIIKIITHKLSKNKNKCTVNFLVINKVVKKGVIIDSGRGTEPSNGEKGGSHLPPPPQRLKQTNNPERITISQPQYNLKDYSFSWNYLNEKSEIPKLIPNEIKLYLLINENTNTERSILLNHGRNILKIDLISDDMIQIKKYYSLARKITLKFILINQNNERLYYPMPGEYKIACFDQEYCGFIQK
jgi:hypothetical protein